MESKLATSRDRLWQLGLFLLLTGGVPAAYGQTPAQTIHSAPWHVREIGLGVVSRACQFGDLFSSRQVIHVVEADMNVAGVAAKLTYLVGGDKKAVSAFATDIPGAAACINGNFFDDAGSAQYLKVDGKLVNTTRNAETADEGGITIDVAGKLAARVRPNAGWASLTAPSVMATNIPVVINGAAYSFSDIPFYKSDRHPRTIIGTKPGNKLLMVVVDGRSQTAAGMTFVEAAEMMLALGADNAVNMDGGGSSAMWDRGTPGNGISNVPSDGGQRPVANAIACVAGTTTTVYAYDARRAPTADHASGFAPVSAAVITSSQTHTVSFSFVNSGTTTWTPSTVFLGTTEQRNRTSTVYRAGEWLSTSRATPVDEDTVAPGQTGTFTFTVQAPTVEAMTSLTEGFGLVTGSGEYFGPEQNRVYLTVMADLGPGEIVIESRGADGALNTAGYVESAPFSNTSAKSDVVDPPVLSSGARFTTVIGRTATFTPTIVQEGRYNAYVTMGAGPNNNATATYVVNNSLPPRSGVVNLMDSDSGLVGKWKLLESNVPLKAGTTGSIRFTNVDGDSSSGKRFVMDAVRFSLVE